MPYKVYLVEDEISTREGIRDNVDWQSAGFVLCGEAPDGEIALPQIEATQPDVLITDIKMPFMDGLQLCKIIREHMAWMKIIIISGYNDFEYAQTAIKLGVTEYLLKPVSVNDLQATLAKVAVLLDQEKSERTYLKRLNSQVEDNLHFLREKFLMRLVMGGESSISAIEQSQQLGLNILSPYYQVLLLELISPTVGSPINYEESQENEKIITAVVGTNKDILLTRKDMEEFVIILKGEELMQLEAEGSFLTGLIQEEVESKTRFKLMVGAGTPQQRLGDLHLSFTDALIKVKGSHTELETGRIKKLNHDELQNFLANGQMSGFDSFFDHSIYHLAESALSSNQLKRYVMIDIALAVSQFVSELGGNTSQIIPNIYDDESVLGSLQTTDQIRAETARLFNAAISFRDSQTYSDHTAILQQARNYIAAHCSDPNLSLNEVAALVNFSPNHFSAVFSQETGGTFRDYLTNTRIEQAKNLLRATKKKISEIAFQCGYNDPHYFSITFRKNCGMTPQKYRDSLKK